MGILPDSASGRRWGKVASLGRRKNVVADESHHSSTGKKWFGRLPGRARALAISLGTAATADTLWGGENGENRDAPFYPAGDDGDRSDHPRKSGGGVQSPLTASKFLSEAEQAAFDEFLASQGADQWRDLAGHREICLQHFEEGGIRLVSSAVPQSSRRDSETGGLISKSNSNEGSSNSSPGKEEEDSDCLDPKIHIHTPSISENPDPASNDVDGRLSAVPKPEQAGGCGDPSIDDRHSGMERKGCSRRSASLSVSRRPCRRSRRSAPLSASRHFSSCTGRPKQSRRSPSSPVPRRPSSSSVSTLSMSSADDESQIGQQRSRSHSRSRYSWIVPPFCRSRSRKAKEPTAEVVFADPQGRCPHHPLVWLRRRSALTGEWRVLQDSCPLCAAANGSAACNLGTLGSSPNVAAQGQKARLRSRSHSLSMSRKYSARRIDEIGGHVGDTAAVDSSLTVSAAFTEAAAELQKVRLRSHSHSCSRPRYCPVDTDYHVDKALDDAEEEEEVSALNEPVLWVSFQAPDDVDDTSASADELSEALAMIEDVQSENASLHQSVAEATQLAQGMGEKLAKFVRVHEASIKDYEERLVQMKEGSGQTEEDLPARLDAAREENKVLRAALVTGGEDVRGWIRLMEEKERAHREDVERATIEQDALRQEIYTLRQALDKSTGRRRESFRISNKDEGIGSMNDSFERVWRAVDETSGGD